MTIQFIGEKKLQSNIRSIAAKGAKLAILIHETAVQAMLWASSVDKDRKVRNDARPMDQLLNALPNGMRKEGFKLWVAKYSPIRWNGDGRVGVMSEKAKSYVPYDVDGANAEPFWDATKENEVKKISPEALLALIKRETDRILSADSDGKIYDKDGKEIAVLTGNVVEMKDFAEKVKSATSNLHVPSKVPAAVKDTLIPGNRNLPVVVEDDLKSVTKVAAAA